MTDEALAAVARITSLKALFLVEAEAKKFELPTRYEKQAFGSQLFGQLCIIKAQCANAAHLQLTTISSSCLPSAAP